MSIKRDAAFYCNFLIFNQLINRREQNINWPAPYPTNKNMVGEFRPVRDIFFIHSKTFNKILIHKVVTFTNKKNILEFPMFSTIF